MAKVRWRKKWGTEGLPDPGAFAQDAGVQPDPEDYMEDWMKDPEAERERLKGEYEEKYVDPMRDLMGQWPEMPDFSGVQGNIDRLLEQLEAGPDQWYGDAHSQAARLAGFETVEDYMAALQRLMPQDDETYRQRAFSEEERAVMGRQAAGADRLSRDEQIRQFEAMTGATGSWVRGMAQYDEMNAQIADTRLQRELAVMGEETARAFQISQREGEQYAAMVQNGTMAVSEYLKFKAGSVMGALDGYFQSAELMLKQWGAEAQSILGQAELIQKTAMLELGIEESILTQMSERFEMAMAPYYAELEQYQAKMAQSAADRATIFGVFKIMLQGVGLFV